MNLEEIYRIYLEKFKKNNIEEISLRIILCDIFKFKTMSDFYLKLNDNFKLKNNDRKKINKVLHGIPVYYVIRNINFLNNNFYINKNVLIPRNDTEYLVEFAIKKINKKFLDNKKVLNIVDLGTGSGCIAISLDKYLKVNKKIFAVDSSKKAIKITRKNKTKLNSSIIIKNDDMLHFLNNNKNLDIIICNPPYISKDYEVDESVIKYEPKKALFIYPSYFYYEKIIENRKKYMNKKYLIIFEIGYDLKPYLENYLNCVLDFKKEKYQFFKDLNNCDRILMIESV